MLPGIVAESDCGVELTFFGDPEFSEVTSAEVAVEQDEAEEGTVGPDFRLSELMSCNNETNQIVFDE